jgi:hypothetical protein
VEQKQRRTGAPLSPTSGYSAKGPRTVTSLSRIMTLTEKAEPLVRWQWVQWQSATIIGWSVSV